MTKKYRLKSPVIEGLKWTGDNLDEVKDFLGSSFISVDGDVIFFEPGPFASYQRTGRCRCADAGSYIIIKNGLFDREEGSAFEEMYEEDI